MTFDDQFFFFFKKKGRYYTFFGQILKSIILMSAFNEYKLILHEKVFHIPSDFRSLLDVKQDVYALIVQNGEYNVKSNVHENILKAFINHWVYQQVPNIFDDNIDEFRALSLEFGRMESIIEMVKNKQTKEESINEMLKSKKCLIEEEKINSVSQYKKIVSYLFNNDFSKYIISNNQNESIVMKYKLIDACKSGNFNYIDSFIRKVVTFEKIEYVIYEESKTAALYNVDNYVFGDICIPRSIHYNGEEFIVTTILQKAFLHANVWVIELAEDSELKFIDNEAFYNCGLRAIKFPKHLKRIGSRAFYYSNQFLEAVFPNDSELEIIDKEAFAYTKLSKIVIPSNMTKISPCAFANCQQLKSVEFQENSKLTEICELSFAYCAIDKIKIPSTVKVICDNAFYCCYNLQDVEIIENSELNTIGTQAFICTPLKNFFIPEKVENLYEGCLHGTPELVNVSLSSKNKNFKFIDDKFIVKKSNPKSDNFDVLIFARRDLIDVTIPSFITEIASFAFSGCSKLKKINFEQNSKLTSIGNYAFFLTQIEGISIPTHVSELSKFVFAKCNQLKIIEIPDDSEIKLIDRSVIVDNVQFLIPSHLRKSITFIEPQEKNNE